MGTELWPGIPAPLTDLSTLFQRHRQPTIQLWCLLLILCLRRRRSSRHPPFFLRVRESGLCLSVSYACFLFLMLCLGRRKKSGFFITQHHACFSPTPLSPFP